MHNFEDIIEKYRKELIEFSKQTPIHTASDSDEYRAVADVMATTAESDPPNIENSALQPSIVARAPYDTYEDFLDNNPSEGLLRVQVFTADRAFPVSNASVDVYVRLSGSDKTVFNGVTNADGIIDNIRLPAPDSSISFDENSTVEPYSVYGLRVTAPNFVEADFEGIPVFDSVKSIQSVELVPLSRDGSRPTNNIVASQPMVLYGGEG